MKAFLIGLTTLGAAAIAVAEDAWWRHQGLCFAVEAPATFTMTTLADAVADDGLMTVRFDAPNGEIAFFLHAPLWAMPTNAVQAKPGEMLLGEKRSTVQGDLVTWRTWRDPQTGRQRSFRMIEESEGASLTIYGVEYADAAVLARWRPAYLRFVRSVQRFAD